MNLDKRESNIKDVPYEICENCFADIESEEKLLKYGSFCLCSQECLDEFKNLVASYERES